MFKLGYDSPLSLPIRTLKAIFPVMGRYYGNLNNSPDAYEHFYVGYIGTLICRILQSYYNYTWALVPILWFFHYVVKELILDGKKHIFNKDRTQVDMLNFWCDTITRNAGFVFALPYFLI